MPAKQLRYYFNAIAACNMCDSPASGHKILGKRLNRSQGKNPRNKTGITVSVLKCSQCGLVYSNPQPVPFDIQDHYGIPPENYWKEDYFKVNPDYFQAEIKILKTLMGIKPGMKSLDIGAGLGKAMVALAEAGFDSYGFEASKQFYERAITKMQMDPARFQLGTIETKEYPPDSFDFISFNAVLEHLYHPSDCIAKTLTWLKPQGVIQIEVPSSDWLVNKIANLFYKLTGSDYVANISPMHEPFHLYEFSLQSFYKHAARQGYEVISHQYHVCETYLPRILDPVLKPYMKATNTGMQLCVWLRKK